VRFSRRQSTCPPYVPSDVDLHGSLGL
jgi:hypothetical protein